MLDNYTTGPVLAGMERRSPGGEGAQENGEKQQWKTERSLDVTLGGKRDLNPIVVKKLIMILQWRWRLRVSNKTDLIADVLKYYLVRLVYMPVRSVIGVALMISSKALSSPSEPDSGSEEDSTLCFACGRSIL